MNKKVKKGDQVIMIKNNNGTVSGLLVDRIYSVTTINSNGSIQAKLEDATGIEQQGYYKGYIISMNSGCYILATKEAKLEHQISLLKELEERIIEVKAEIEFLDKYDSMEEFVADKIDALLKADTKETRIELLKTLKQTNYL